MLWLFFLVCFFLSETPQANISSPSSSLTESQNAGIRRKLNLTLLISFKTYFLVKKLTGFYMWNWMSSLNSNSCSGSAYCLLSDSILKQVNLFTWKVLPHIEIELIHLNFHMLT